MVNQKTPLGMRAREGSTLSPKQERPLRPSLMASWELITQVWLRAMLTKNLQKSRALALTRQCYWAWAAVAVEAVVEVVQQQQQPSQSLLQALLLKATLMEPPFGETQMQTGCMTLGSTTRSLPTLQVLTRDLEAVELSM